MNISVIKNRPGNLGSQYETQSAFYKVVIVLILAVSTPVWAQQQTQFDEDVGAGPQSHVADHVAAADDSVNHDTMDHTSMPDTEADTASHNARSVQLETRDPHAYAEGMDFGPLGQPRLSDQHSFSALIVDRLEAVSGRDNSSLAYELQAWYGRTFDRVTLKAEGDVDSGRLQESETELLWSHAVATFWDTQLGVRYDAGVEPDRKWLAAGIQGLAPYWFEVNATAYVGEHGDSALKLSGEYELLLTQRLILRPQMQAILYGQSDYVRQTGSCLSELQVRQRIRYEFTRQFAPYIGVEWTGKFGGTADFAKAASEHTDDTRWVAGLRMWF